MSVWCLEGERGTLAGSEGALVSVCVNVEPRYLEALLDALAQLDFPINPQIYHDASIRYRYADGREEAEPTTLVEFPAWEGRLAEVRRALEDYGFRPESLHVADMLSDIHSDGFAEPAPPGAEYVSRVYRKRPEVRRAGAQ